MKKTILLSLLLFSLLSLKATHNRAGEILYKRVAPFSNASGQVYTYSITLITYTDDGPAIADRCNDTIYFGDGQQGLAVRINGPVTGNCGCGSTVGCGEIIINETNYRVKKNIYTVIHTYAGPGSYVVHLFDVNRNANVVNVPNSVNQPFYIESLITISASTAANASPELTNAPIDRGFTGSCFYHNPAAYDADGDSLSYAIIACKGSQGLDIPGYVFPDAGVSGSFNIHVVNGLLTWCNPQAVGQYNVAIKIREWRKPSCNAAYQVIGYVIRDMQIIIKGATFPSYPLIPVSDTCVVAGSLVLRTFTSGSTPQVYGSCVSNSQPSATVTQASANSAVFTWQTNCNAIQQQPHQVNITYNVSSASDTKRMYQKFNVRVVPPAPQIYSIVRGTNTVTVRWHKLNSCSKVTGYNVYRKNGPDSWQHGDCETGVPTSSGYLLDFSGHVNDTSFTDLFVRDFANGSQANYIVTAVTGDCAESFASATSTISILVGIKENQLDASQVAVFPNPFKDELVIKLDQKTGSPLQVTVFSTDGRIIYEATTTADQPVKINSESFSPGVYLLRIKTANGQAYKKVIKN